MKVRIVPPNKKVYFTDGVPTIISGGKYYPIGYFVLKLHCLREVLLNKSAVKHTRHHLRRLKPYYAMPLVLNVCKNW